MILKDVHTSEELHAWAAQEFADAELGDVRRADRLVTIAGAMAMAPGASIPELFARAYDVKAAYTFFSDEHVVPDEVQATHRHQVQQAMRAPGTVLLTEDTTDLSWSGKQAIPGLGPIGNSRKGLQGVLLHSVLACRWHGEALEAGRPRPAVEVMGLADQQYEVRCPRPAGEPHSSQKAKLRWRESAIWMRAGERVGQAPEHEAVRWIRVCDRGADIYEELVSCHDYGHGFRIRAAQDRAVLDPQTLTSSGRLFEAARSAASLGSFQVQVRARPKQKARVAALNVSTTRVLLRPPWRPKTAQPKLEPLWVSVVRVWEPEAAPGVKKPIEWVLLCDHHVVGFEQAIECAVQYATRWIIEDMHKVLKSGLGAQKLQMKKAHALFAAISIKSVIAMKVLDLREKARLIPESAAVDSGLSEEELEVLRAYTGRTIETVREVALAVGRLGGHLNRKSDGMPGTQTLGRGYEKLLLLVQGVRLARKVQKFG
jgi:Transposase DNA-binding